MTQVSSEEAREAGKGYLLLRCNGSCKPRWHRGMFGAPFVLRALFLSSYLSCRIWPGIWPGDHMWDWLLRLLLYRQVCVLSG